eukprot:256103-Rhodomonas_salina.1
MVGDGEEGGARSGLTGVGGGEEAFEPGGVGDGGELVGVEELELVGHSVLARGHVRGHRPHVTLHRTLQLPHLRL